MRQLRVRASSVKEPEYTARNQGGGGEYSNFYGRKQHNNFHFKIKLPISAEIKIENLSTEKKKGRKECNKLSRRQVIILEPS